MTPAGEVPSLDEARQGPWNISVLIPSTTAARCNRSSLSSGEAELHRPDVQRLDAVGAAVGRGQLEAQAGNAHGQHGDNRSAQPHGIWTSTTSRSPMALDAGSCPSGTILTEKSGTVKNDSDLTTKYHDEGRPGALMRQSTDVDANITGVGRWIARLVIQAVCVWADPVAHTKVHEGKAGNETCGWEGHDRQSS